jgi:hypothetical protein
MPMPVFSRMNRSFQLFTRSALSPTTPLVGGTPRAEQARSLPPDAILARQFVSDAHFVTGSPHHPDQIVERRDDLTSSRPSFSRGLLVQSQSPGISPCSRI